MLAKIKLEELESAIAHVKKNSTDSAVKIGQDPHMNSRLIITATDATGKEIKITIYDESTAKMPEVTQTSWLRKSNG